MRSNKPPHVDKPLLVCYIGYMKMMLIKCWTDLYFPVLLDDHMYYYVSFGEIVEGNDTRKFVEFNRALLSRDYVKDLDLLVPLFQKLSKRDFYKDLLQE